MVDNSGPRRRVSNMVRVVRLAAVGRSIVMIRIVFLDLKESVTKNLYESSRMGRQTLWKLAD